MSVAYSKGDLLGGRYQVVGFLGAFGQSNAYAAIDTKTGKKVFIKQTNADPSSSSGQIAIKRAQRELAISKKLNPEHSAQVLGSFEHEGSFFLVFEFVDGHDLQEILDRQATPFTCDETRDILRQTAEGLGDAHRNGIIHRDLKLRNVMRNEKGRIIIVDWQLCKVDSEKTLCEVSYPLGTVHWMSPEHIGCVGVDRQSDLWGLGVLGYVCVTRDLPFPGSDAEEVFPKILSIGPVPPRELNPDIDPDLNSIILKLLEKEKTRRYSDCAALIRDLEMGFSGSAAGTRCSCGEPLASGVRFCVRCGAARTMSLMPFTATVVILNGKNTGKIISVPPTGLELGRYDLDVEDDFISRRHARLFFTAGSFWIEDLGSLNGTSVNGLHLPKGGRHPLKSGDRIRFADTFCEFGA